MLQKYSDKQILSELKRVYKINSNQPYTRRDFEDMAVISKTTVENRFGSWTEALKEAKLYNRFEKAKKAKK
jgi:hypothetical protein